MIQNPAYSLISTFLFLVAIGLLLLLELTSTLLSLLFILTPILLIWISLSFYKYLKGEQKKNFFTAEKDTDWFI